MPILVNISSITLSIIQQIKLASQVFCVPGSGPPFPTPPNPWCILGTPGFGSGTGDLSTLGTILTGGFYGLGLISYIFAIAALILIFMIISSGYTLLTSAGNPEAMEKAKKRLTAALTGFLVVISAFWIFQLVGLLFDTSFAP